MRKHRVTLSLALLVAAAAFAGGAAPAVNGQQKFTVYAVATTAQFMNHADDRLRGMIANPFNVKGAAVIIAAQGQEKGYGPFPGDDILYSFKLYADQKATQSIGGALFTCYYDFVKHAICDTYYELKGGTLLASGPIRFGKARFKLAVSGGTDKFLGAGGEVVAVASGKTSQRLNFVLALK
jgi:hypothetical protein